MAVNDVFRMALVHSAVGADGDIVVTHHWRQIADQTATTGNALMQRLLDSWQSEVQALWLDILTDKITLVRIEVRGVTNPLFGADEAVGLPGNRAAVSDAVTSLRVAPVVSLQTGLIGRSFRGRNFLPPMDEGDISGGVVSVGLQALISAYYNQALAISDGTPLPDRWAMTVFSRTLTGELGPVVDNPVLSFVVRSVAGSQRGRQRVS